MKTNKIIKAISAFLSIILAVSATISVSATELSSQQNAQDADMIIEYNDKKEYLQALENKVKEQTPSYYAQCQAEREFHKAYLETFFQQVPYWDLEDNMLVLYPYKGIDTSIYTLEDFEEYGVIDIDIDASEYQPDIMVLTLDKHNRHNVIDTCLALMDMPSIFLAEPEIIP